MVHVGSRIIWFFAIQPDSWFRELREQAHGCCLVFSSIIPEIMRVQCEHYRAIKNAERKSFA